MNNKELRKAPIFFLSLALNRAIGMGIDMKNFHIITMKSDDLVEKLRLKGSSVFCLEEVSKDLDIKNSFDLLKHPEVKSFIEAKSFGDKPNILTFRSLPQIQKYCENSGYNFMHSDAYLVRDLEDKVLFYKLLEEDGVKIMECQLKTMESCIWPGRKSVLQLRRGFAGNSTFILENEKDFLLFQEKYKKHQVKLAPFYEGQTITLNGCITDKEKCFGVPFYQITGETKLNINKLGTSGNSHFLMGTLKTEAEKKLYKVIKDVVSAIYKKGYRGYFGLDFLMADDGEFYPIECNPRLTASVGNYEERDKEGNRQQGIERKTLLAKHIEYFLKDTENNEEPDFVISPNHDLGYSFAIFRNIHSEEKEFIFPYKIGKYENLNKPEFISEDIFEPLKNDEFIFYPAKHKSMIEPDKECLYLISNENLYQGGLLDKRALKFSEELFN